MFPKIKDQLRHGGNDEILELIISGKLHRTVTGKYSRGKGLPGIGEALKRNQLTNLIIISNDVAGYISQNKYQKLSSMFNGTYVYWELNANNEHC